MNEDRTAGRIRMHTFNRQKVMRDGLRMTYGILRRTVRPAITIIPGLREGLGPFGRPDRTVELQQDAVVAYLMPDQDRRTADIPDALQAPIIRGIAAPALHAGDIEMSVRGIEAAVLHARTESACETLRRALPDSAGFLPADRPSTAGTEREMQEITLARQRWPTASSEEKLPGAGVILSARKMQQGRRRRLAVPGTAPAEIRTFAEAGFNQADGR